MVCSTWAIGIDGRVLYVFLRAFERRSRIIPYRQVRSYHMPTQCQRRWRPCVYVAHKDMTDTGFGGNQIIYVRPTLWKGDCTFRVCNSYTRRMLTMFSSNLHKQLVIFWSSFLGFGKRITTVACQDGKTHVLIRSYSRKTTRFEGMPQRDDILHYSQSSLGRLQCTENAWWWNTTFSRTGEECHLLCRQLLHE